MTQFSLGSRDGGLPIAGLRGLRGKARDELNPPSNSGGIAATQPFICWRPLPTECHYDLRSSIDLEQYTF